MVGVAAQWIGLGVIGIGVLLILIGVITGAKDLFSKMNQGAAQAGLPEKFFDVLITLVKAPPAIAFSGLGVLVVGLGVYLTVHFSGPGECDIAAAPSAILLNYVTNR